MNAWHYEKDGQRLGTVSAADIGSLIENRANDGKTLVLAQGLQDWTPLAQTELRTRQATPPCLAKHQDQ